MNAACSSVRPKVSVVMPIYNGDRYLAQAIDSVLAQTLTEWELLVIDDGSTDTTPAIMADYVHREVQSGNARLRYVWQTNQGVSAARNHGIQLARGEAIAFLDADDWFVPTKLEQQWAILAENAAVGMVHGGWQRVDAAGRKLMNVTPWHHCPQLDLEQWLEWKPVLPSAIMVRRSWLLKADGFNPRLHLAEDTDLMLRLAAMGCRTEWLRQIVVYYRQHDTNAMHNGLAQARSLSLVMDQLFERSDLPSGVRRKERHFRFATWVWMAWDLYRTGHSTAMAEYLRQAWRYSPHTPLDTMITWVESFAQFSRQWGQPLDTHALCQSAAWQELTRWCFAQGEPIGN